MSGTPTAGAVLAAMAAALVLALAAPAAADHDADAHSANTSLVASLKLGGLGDIAFHGDLAVVSRFTFDDGSTHGLSVIDIADPRVPRELGRLACTGAGWDVSLWRDLAFLSVDDFSPSVDGSCAAPAGDGFAGLKVVSVADPTRPQQVGSIPVPCSGSHTNTILPDPASADRVLVYVGSLDYAGTAEAGCDVILDVPLADPSSAKVVGSLGADAVEGCHDITAFLPRALLAAACANELRLYDISDPRAPALVSVLVNPANTGQHSAAFSADGTTLVSGEESLFYTGATGACPGGTRAPVGALWFHDISDPARPLVRGYHQLERGRELRSPNGAGCSAHNFNVVPARSDRDVLITSWYAGGVSAIDFTDPAAPAEIAHYQPDLGDPERRGHFWSAYWYRGHVFATNTFESGRLSFDVLTVDDPDLAASYRLPRLNPQTQEALTEAATSAGAPPSEPASQPAATAPPRRRACAQRRNVRIGGSRRVLRAELRSAGRRVRRVRVRRGVARVDLRGLPAGRYTLRVRYRDGKGRVRTYVRSIAGCG